jgi:hypothetical protein
LPAGSHVEAARFGLQDSAPRDALLGMHARIESCAPDAWQDPRLTQTYSPRAAVYLLPLEDFGCSRSAGCPSTRRHDTRSKAPPRTCAAS